MNLRFYSINTFAISSTMTKVLEKNRDHEVIPFLLHCRLAPPKGYTIYSISDTEEDLEKRARMDWMC